MRASVLAIQDIEQVAPEEALRQALELLREAENKRDMEVKGDILHQLGRISRSLNNWEAAKEYFELAYENHTALLQHKESITDLNRIGEIYIERGDYLLAKEKFEQSLQLCTEIDYPSGIAGASSNIGGVLFVLGRYESAISNYHMALSTYETLGEQKKITSCLQNIANIYLAQGEMSLALETNQRALTIAKNLEDGMRIIQLSNNIGSIYIKLYDNARALAYFTISAEQSQTVGYTAGILTAKINIGHTLMAQSKYAEALAILEESLAMSIESKAAGNEIQARINMATCLWRMGDAATGLAQLHTALPMAESRQALHQVAEILYDLSRIYESQGEMDDALHYYKRHTATKDEIMNIEVSRTIQEMKTKYDVERKEKESELNRLRNIELREALDNLEIEKQKSDSLLLNILPANVAEELKIEGRIKARHYEQVAVMFIDIRNFTVHGMSMSPEQLVGVLDSYFCLIDEIIATRPIEKIKTIGDAYLCAAGIPEPSPNCVTDMVQTAVDIRDTVTAFNVLREAEGKPIFEFRIGIHSGPIVAGVVGRLKFEYDIWGDTVNTAARMEQHGESAKINISGTVYEIVKNQFNCIYRGKLDAKNKGLTDMYFVEGVAP